MGNRRHYYRNAAAAAASRMAPQTQPDNLQQLNNIPRVSHGQQPCHTQLSINNLGMQHTQSMNTQCGQFDLENSNNNLDVMGIGNNNGILGNTGIAMNQPGGYNHQGKVPYNMYLF